jgi:hypothetical protein
LIVPETKTATAVDKEVCSSRAHVVVITINTQVTLRVSMLAHAVELGGTFALSVEVQNHTSGKTIDGVFVSVVYVTGFNTDRASLKLTVCCVRA